MNVRSEVSGLAVAAILGALIGGVFNLPAFFPEFIAPCILVLGVLAATLIGGYIGYFVPTVRTSLVRIILGISYAAVMAILVTDISLFIILNTRGS